MIVTINTDASFSKTHGVGAGAIWIVSNDFKIKYSSVLRSKTLNPTIAEAHTILNALHLVFRQNISANTRVIINTDSMNAIYIFTTNKDMISKYRIKGWKELQRHLDKAKSLKPGVTDKIHIEFRHVKAHVSTDTARTFVNEWCDQEAKRVLRKEINLKKK